MVGFYRQLPGNTLLQQYGGSQLPATLGETTGEIFSDPLNRPTDLIETEIDIQQERGIDGRRQVFPGPPEMQPGIVDREVPEIPEAQLSPLVDPEKLNERYGDLGLKFDKPERENVARILAEQKRAEMIRNDVIARGPRGVWATTAQFGAALASSALDPLNVASAFVPVVGEARFAAWAGRIGLLRARALAGAVEGTVGAALVEPITYGLARRQQLDYEMADALLNVGIGTILGAGLRTGFGAIGDRIRGPQEREAVLKTALAQAIEGRSIDVEPVLRAPEGPRARELMGSTSLRALERGQEAPAGFQPEFRASPFADPLSRISEPESATAPSPDVAVSEPPVRVPSMSRRGGLRVFDTEREARDSLRRMRGENLDVERLPDGRFAVVRDVADAQVERRPTGEVLRFANRRAAQKHIERVRKGDPAYRVVPLGDGNFSVVRGLSDRDVAAIEASPRTARIADVRRERFTPAPRPKPMSQAEFRRRLGLENAPWRDATADFEAAREIAREATAEPPKVISRAESSSPAQDEADFAQSLVDGLREQGRLSEASAKEVEAMNTLTQKAESWGRAARQAAVCMTRQ